MTPKQRRLAAALAAHAMRHGGYPTPEIEWQRATNDLRREPTADDLRRAGITIPEENQ